MAGKCLLVIIASILLGTTCLAQSTRLRPGNYYVDYGFGPPRLHMTRLSRNRKLASIGDTIYMLDERSRISWKWTSDGQEFTDLPIVDSTGTVYVIGTDLLWAAIDPTTGKEKWRVTTNGRALFSQIKLYRRNMYLVVIDMGGYRDSLRDQKIEDRLSLCKGNVVLWETHIPPDSRITVVGNRIFNVFRQRKHLVRRPITTPLHLGKPITRLDGLAKHD